MNDTAAVLDRIEQRVFRANRGSLRLNVCEKIALNAWGCYRFRGTARTEFHADTVLVAVAIARATLIDHITVKLAGEIPDKNDIPL